jgi:23S rRNA (pseudouridine1915-N3)-methyltransferase
MKLKLITIGKPKARHFAAAAEEYQARLEHYLPTDFIAAKNDIEALKKISPTDFLVACDKSGKQISSEGLARFIDERKLRSTKSVVFFIGGPEGIGKEVLTRANYVLSFSSMTFAHELALVVLLEQLYRACTILKGEPYHK